MLAASARTVVAVLASFATSLHAQEVGDVLIVTREEGGELRRGGRVIEVLPLGCPVRVREVNEDRYFARSWTGKDWSIGEQGWIERAVVSPAQEAVDRLSAAVKENPTAENYISRGLARTGAGEYEAAARDLTEALTLEPGSAAAHLYRSIALQSLGRADEAERDRREALRLAPDWHLAHVALGAAALAAGKYKIAFKSFSRAIELKPRWATLHFLRGMAAGRGFAYKKAILEFEEAIRLDPELPEPYAFRGFTRLLTRPHEESTAEAFEKAHADIAVAIRLEPQNAVVREIRNRIVTLRDKIDVGRASRPPVEASRP